MSEYFTLEVDPTEDPDVIELVVNQTLTAEEEEVYNSPSEGEVGSPIAQLLFHAVAGIRSLIITEDTLIITRDPAIAWEDIVDDVRDALRDFFL